MRHFLINTKLYVVIKKTINNSVYIYIKIKQKTYIKTVKKNKFLIYIYIYLYITKKKLIGSISRLENSADPKS
jgi:hypothetical protein